MKNKAEKLRDLLGHAIEIIDKKFDIKNINTDIVLDTEVCGKRSVILCRPITFEEIHVSVWWGYKLPKIPQNASCPTPLSILPKNKILDVLIGGWIERKEGLWIEGKDAKKLSPKYCARTAEQDLSEIPPYKSNKIARTGKYYL